MRRCAVIAAGQLDIDHVAALEGLHTPVTVERRCEDLAELIAVARTIRADAVLIVGGTDQLTESVLAQLRAQELTVVVISDLPAERSRLERLGSATFADDVDPALLARALQGGPGPDAAPNSAATEEDVFAGVLDASGLTPLEETAPETSSASVPRRALGGVVAVWGASGAPGRTTVAVNLAAELGISGGRTLLIDADTYAASVAVHLGLLEESAGLAQACRAADFGSLDAEFLEQTVTAVETCGSRFDVLTGLPRPDRWTELRPGPLERLLALTRTRYDHVIVDLAAEIEQDEELAFEGAPQRNGAAVTVLGSADQVLVLGSADPVSFSRLVRALQHYREILSQAPMPRVVMNQLRKEVVGRSPRRQLTEAWDELAPGPPLADFLPWDRAACDAALRAGEVLAEAAPDSPLRRQIAALGGIELWGRRRGLVSGARRGNKTRDNGPAEARPNSRRRQSERIG